MHGAPEGFSGLCFPGNLFSCPRAWSISTAVETAETVAGVNGNPRDRAKDYLAGKTATTRKIVRNRRVLVRSPE